MINEGVKQIMEFLDKTYRKDNTSLMMTSWSDFINIRKKESQNMNGFLNDFDQANANLKISKIELPKTVLALHMLERSGLTANDKKLVMTGVNLDDVGNVVDDMVNSIKKSIFVKEYVMIVRKDLIMLINLWVELQLKKSLCTMVRKYILNLQSLCIHHQTLVIHLKKRKPSTQTGGIEENLTRHGKIK